nr:MAG TPA: hypothetical protein [Inoviridae sp.]
MNGFRLHRKCISFFTLQFPDRRCSVYFMRYRKGKT